MVDKDTVSHDDGVRVRRKAWESLVSPVTSSACVTSGAFETRSFQPEPMCVTPNAHPEGGRPLSFFYQFVCLTEPNDNENPTDLRMSHFL